jgi:hypothetical protein
MISKSSYKYEPLVLRCHPKDEEVLTGRQKRNLRRKKNKNKLKITYVKFA